jgi:hypothetical protein
LDIAELTNAPREVELKGKKYLVSALKLRHWGELQAWLKDHSPSPVARLRSADLAGLSEADRSAVLRMAFAETMAWPPHVGSAGWLRAISAAPGGEAKFLTAVLGRHRDLPEAEAEELAERLDGTDYARLLYYASGQEPPDPKGGSPATTAGGSPAGTNGGSSSTSSAGPATA